MMKSELLNSISSVAAENPRSEIRNRTRGVREWYVAGADTRGRQEGQPYPWSQQVIHEISGLRLFGRHYHSFVKKPVIPRSGVRDQCTNRDNLLEATVGKQHFQFLVSKKASEIGDVPDESIFFA